MWSPKPTPVAAHRIRDQALWKGHWKRTGCLGSLGGKDASIFGSDRSRPPAIMTSWAHDSHHALLGNHLSSFRGLGTDAQLKKSLQRMEGRGLGKRLTGGTCWDFGSDEWGQHHGELPKCHVSFSFPKETKNWGLVCWMNESSREWRWGTEEGHPTPSYLSPSGPFCAPLLPWPPPSLYLPIDSILSLPPALYKSPLSSWGDDSLCPVPHSSESSGSLFLMPGALRLSSALGVGSYFHS